MLVPILVRFANFRNLLNVNNNIIGISSKVMQPLDNISRFCTTVTDTSTEVPVSKQNVDDVPISKAMKAYLKRAEEHEKFMAKEMLVYEVGRRHLANMMGENPEHFTQADVDNAINYLFPSGIFEPKARPMMKHPNETFPKTKAAEFDKYGRPYHSLFYTGQPNYFQMLYDIIEQFHKLNHMEDQFIKNTGNFPDNKFDALGSRWLSKLETERLLLETLTDENYKYLTTTLEKLLNHSLSGHITDFINKYRVQYTNTISDSMVEPLLYDDKGRPYVTVNQCARKSARGTVTIRGNGSGKITINGKDILYFHDVQSRQQVTFPLFFTNMADKVDVEATVQNGGPTGQAGAIRWGISWGLRNFVDKGMIQKMRMAGLLQRDWRKRERKKPGQEGARRKFTWKKR